MARALMFTILTCARSGETFAHAVERRWITADDRVWRVPAERMKMEKPHSVPLSDQALDILEAQHAARGANPYVFPGERPMRGL